MSIQAKEKEIELVVTWVCNWHCDYCCVDTHNRPKLTMDDVRLKLDKIIPGYNVTLSGGEVGSMKREDVEYILSALKSKGCKISINTNGLFIKRYRDLLPCFEEILYHCSEDLDINDDVIIDPALNLQYLLIVTDNNFSKLDAFLQKYPDIKFHLVAATNPEGIHKVVLSPSLKHKMLTKQHNRMSEQSKKRIFKEKDFDSIIYL
jgi:organic radical activating enzyme